METHIDPSRILISHGALEPSKYLGHPHHRQEQEYSPERISALPGSFKGNHMLDIGMIAIGVGFFAASILYVLACERM